MSITIVHRKTSYGIWTHDLCNTGEVLYQLSYKPTGHYVESKQIDIFCALKDNWLLKWISESSFQYSFSLDQRQGESYP